MTLHGFPLLVLGAALCLSSCATSPPARYHTLSLSSVSTEPLPSGNARILVEILPIAVPDRFDRPQLVLIPPSNTPSGRLDILSDDRWAAPLNSEARQAIADALWRDLRAIDVYQAAPPVEKEGMPHYRLALRLERFDALIGQKTSVEATWTLRRLPRGQTHSCRITISSPLSAASSGEKAALTDAAVIALGQDINRLGKAIALSLHAMEQEQHPLCPGEDTVP